MQEEGSQVEGTIEGTVEGTIRPAQSPPPPPAPEPVPEEASEPSSSGGTEVEDATQAEETESSSGGPMSDEEFEEKQREWDKLATAAAEEHYEETGQAAVRDQIREAEQIMRSPTPEALERLGAVIGDPTKGPSS